MTKAYDLKVLGERLKAKGLVQAEETAFEILDATLEWAKESAILSETPYDDFLIPAFAKLKELVTPVLDKIDGEENR